MSKTQEKHLKYEEITEYHSKLVDEYLNNGNNKAQAMLKFKPSLTYSSTINAFNKIIVRPEVKQYLKERQRELKERANIKSLDILNKLKTQINIDASTFIGLKPDQIKELPIEVKQCIQDIDYKERKYTNKQGKRTVETHVKIKLVDKQKALDMINKHIGFYSEDNKQRANKINIDKLNVNVLNALLQASTDSQ